MPASTYAANKILDLLLRGVAFSAPATVYISLHTDNPGNTGESEIDTTDWPAYERQDPADGGDADTGFTAPSNKQTQNAKDLLFPAHDGDTNITVTHIAIWDAAVGGNCLVTAALDASKIIQPTDELTLKVGDLTALIV